MELSVTYRLGPQILLSNTQWPSQRCYAGIHSMRRYIGCETTEINVQRDHVYLTVMVPLKLSVSYFMGQLKGQTAIRLLKQF